MLKEQLTTIFKNEHLEDYNATELDLSSGQDYGDGARLYNDIIGNVTPIIFDYLYSGGETSLICSYWSNKLRRSIILDDNITEYWEAEDGETIGDAIIIYLVALVEQAEALENNIIVAPKENRDAIIEALNIAVERDEEILEDDPNLSDEDVNDYKETIKFNQSLANSLIIK